MDNAYSTMQSCLQKAVNGRNICDIYGDLVAGKLKLMYESTRKLCMHRIDNIMFKMKMNTNMAFSTNPHIPRTQPLFINSQSQSSTSSHLKSLYHNFASSAYITLSSQHTSPSPDHTIEAPQHTIPSPQHVPFHSSVPQNTRTCLNYAKCKLVRRKCISKK